MVDHATRQILDLAISPSFSRDGIGFLATTTGLQVTRDGGQQWNPVTWDVGTPDDIPVTAVAFSPGDSSVVVAIPGGVGISRDVGETWAFAPLPHTSIVVTSIALSPSFAQSVAMVVGTVQDGVLCSSDGGQTWEAWNSGLLDRSIATVAMSSAETVFAGTDLGVYASHNGGRRWHLGRLGDALSAVVTLAVTADDVVLAGTEDTGLWCSRNAGSTWSRVAEPELGGEVSLLAVVPGSSKVAIATDSGLRLVCLKDDETVRTLNIPVAIDNVVALSVMYGEAGEAQAVLVDHGANLYRVDLTD